MTRLTHPWEAWKKIAHRIGNFQSRLLLVAVYLVIVLPFGLGVRLFADSLRTKHRPTEWLDYPDDSSTEGWARRQ